MSDDYLWSGSGPPDSEIEALERRLKPLAHRDTPFTGAAQASVPAPAPSRRAPYLWLAAAAAAVLIAAIGAPQWAANRAAPSGWEIERLAGAPTLGGSALGDNTRLRSGQLLETDAGASAALHGAIGSVTIEPGSRVRVLRSNASDQRLSLERGALRALIVAPPRQFTVETPAVHAVDLGCAYRLEVADDGRSTVTVESGWVSFEAHGRETFIPAGARCVTRRGAAPGTPVSLEASAEFQNALAAFDDAGNEAARRSQIAPLLAAAGPGDALSLWHLLAQPDPAARGAVFDRLRALAPPPASVTRAGIVAGERAMLDAWWNTLGYGDVDWWRLWQGAAPAGG